MSPNKPYRPLKDQEIKVLQSQGCAAEDWSTVQVAEGFDASRVRQATFAGPIRIGSLSGQVVSGAGLSKPAGIYQAYLVNCTLGDNVRIANIGVHLAGYTIGDEACIEHVGLMQSKVGATFGNGVEIEALNEGGGREIVLFNDLSSQFAHLICLHRYRPGLIAKLKVMAQSAAAQAKVDRGTVGPRARVLSVGQITDVNIGDHALVQGASALSNGTILSNAEAPTFIGAAVQAEDFIIAEGTKVTGGAIVSKSYVGQGCQVGKQYSAEGSVFFANCEAFHGEACSIFAGPYTVTHHKSTLLIAGLFSFYNAGSGTNQSNHMYKLGPVHEGKLERGSKTGSFSYMMWPCRVGPFSVVLGKHTRNFDTSDFPFSHIEATSEGKCSLIPGLNLTTVGTVRDGAKWPTRDRRKGPVKRDRISFEVFNPLTVGRMIKGSAILHELQGKTDKSVDTVTVRGAEIKRVLLRSGQKFYRPGIQMYLLEKVVEHLETAIKAGRQGLAQALAVDPHAVYDPQWVDIGGQLMPRRRLDDLCAAVESGRISDLKSLEAELDRIFAAYAIDEWAWVKHTYPQVFEMELDQAGMSDIAQAAESLLAARSKFIHLILADAAKEFDELTRTGFGQDGRPEDIATDFTAVRGEYDGNKFVKQMRQSIEELTQRIEQFKQTLTQTV